MYGTRIGVLGAIILASAIACSRDVDVEQVPIGADVQLTRDDGGVVQGKLADRDPNIVTVSTTQTTKTVPRAEIADVRLVERDKPTELPAIAKFREYTVPDNSRLSLTIEEPLSSETTGVEDAVLAKVASPVRVDGVDVIPSGSVVRGHVTAAQPSGKVKGRARLALAFTSLTIGDKRYPIDASWSADAESTRTDDAAKISVGAAGGAIIGGAIGGGKGAAAGAAAGGGAGTAWVLATEGKPVSLQGGATIGVTLTDPVEIQVPLKPQDSNPR